MATKTYGPGTEVTTKKWGSGVIKSVEYVNLPSDGDHTFYVVEMEDGRTRNLKAADFGKE